MRVLCSTTPMEGTFGPFAALGRALVAAGHEVVVASGPDLQPRIEAEGFAGAVAGPPAMEGAITAMGHPDVQAAPKEDRIAFPAVMFGDVFPRRRLPALRTIADDLGPDLVIHPPTDLAGPLLAAERDLPSVCYGFVHPMEPAVVAGMAERVADLWIEGGLPRDPHGGMYRGLYLDPCPESLAGGHAVPAARWPLRPHIPGRAEAPLPAWAAELGGRPVVHVTLGTVPLWNQPDRFRPLIGDLSGEDIDVVVTVGELNDPGALGPLPPNVHAERWLPLAPLLRLCDLVVCHGGTGTTLAALAAGLPLVVVPQGADQLINAASCQAAGVGRVLRGEEVTPAAVREAVRAILAAGSPERAAAARLATEIATMPAAEEVAARLASELVSPARAGR